VLVGRDECSTHARVEANFLVDRSGLIGQAGGEIQANGHQRSMPTLPLVTGNMLHCGPASLAGELRKACLVDLMSAARFDADRTKMVQPLDQAEHGGWPCGFWHLPQPG
jgi:hypothetical protein